MSYDPLEELAKARRGRATVIFPQPQPPELEPWMKRKWIDPRSLPPIPSVPVENTAITPNMPACVDLDNFTRHLQNKFNYRTEQARKNQYSPVSRHSALIKHWFGK
jgi:hypothetical protein